MMIAKQTRHHLLTLTACLALITAQIVVAQPTSAVVLMYHHVGESQHPSTNVRIEQFEQHLQFLAQNNFQVLPLNRILEAIQTQQPLPDKSIAITMDDAYRSVYTEAYPRLKQRGWPFTVFVSTDYIDKGYSNYMTWAQMREMESNGAHFGNHSRSHDYLIRRLENETEAAWQQRIRNDLNYAQQRLRKELKHPLKIFAYPYGEYDLQLLDIIQTLEMTGMGQHSGAIGPTSDFRFLPRFPMNETFAEISSFTSKVMSLAMPLKQTPVVNPVIDEAQPTLTLELSQSITQMACYASGEGKMNLQWQTKRIFSVRASQPLPTGRSRYNCTAPSVEAGRFYWFSQLWIRPESLQQP